MVLVLNCSCDSGLVIFLLWWTASLRRFNCSADNFLWCLNSCRFIMFGLLMNESNHLEEPGPSRRAHPSCCTNWSLSLYYCTEDAPKYDWFLSRKLKGTSSFFGGIYYIPPLRDTQWATSTVATQKDWETLEDERKVQGFSNAGVQPLFSVDFEDTGCK